MDVHPQIHVGLHDRYAISHSGLIVIFLPFAFAYFFEMQKEYLKLQARTSALMKSTVATTSYEGHSVLYELIILQTYLYTNHLRNHRNTNSLVNKIQLELAIYNNYNITVLIYFNSYCTEKNAWLLGIEKGRGKVSGYRF